MLTSNETQLKAFLYEEVTIIEGNMKLNQILIPKILRISFILLLTSTYSFLFFYSESYSDDKTAQELFYDAFNKEIIYTDFSHFNTKSSEKFLSQACALYKQSRNLSLGTQEQFFAPSIILSQACEGLDGQRPLDERVAEINFLEGTPDFIEEQKKAFINQRHEAAEAAFKAFTLFSESNAHQETTNNPIAIEWLKRSLVMGNYEKAAKTLSMCLLTGTHGLSINIELAMKLQDYKNPIGDDSADNDFIPEESNPQPCAAQLVDALSAFQASCNADKKEDSPHKSHKRTRSEGNILNSVMLDGNWKSAIEFMELKNKGPQPRRLDVSPRSNDEISDHAIKEFEPGYEAEEEHTSQETCDELGNDEDIFTDGSFDIEALLLTPKRLTKAVKAVHKELYQRTEDYLAKEITWEKLSAQLGVSAPSSLKVKPFLPPKLRRELGGFITRRNTDGQLLKRTKKAKSESNLRQIHYPEKSGSSR